MYTISVTYGDHCLRYRHCGRQKLPCSLYIMEDTAPDNVSSVCDKGTGNFANVNQNYSLDKLSCRIFVHKCIILQVTYFMTGYNLLYLGEVRLGGWGRKWPPHLVVHGVTPGSVLKHHPWWVQRTIWVGSWG